MGKEKQSEYVYIKLGAMRVGFVYIIYMSIVHNRENNNGVADRMYWLLNLGTVAL